MMTTVSPTLKNGGCLNKLNHFHHIFFQALYDFLLYRLEDGNVEINIGIVYQEMKMILIL
jgi:hypothetical protein